MRNNITLKPYQQKAIDTVLPLIGKQKKILILMPNGTGKHITVLYLLYQYLKINLDFNNSKTLILVNNKTQSQQIEDLIAQIFDRSDMINSTYPSITSSSIFIINIHQQNNFSKIIQERFEYIILFDCESLLRSNSQLAYALDNIGYRTIIGVDSVIRIEREISSYFEDVTFSYSFEDAINEGVLLPVKYTQVKVENLSLIGEKNIFYNQNNTEQLFFDDGMIENLAKSVINQIDDEKTLVFCPTINSAIRLSHIINELIKNTKFSKTVISNQPYNDNQLIIKNFSNNDETKILVNVDILSTGVNLPVVKKIVFLSHRSEEQLIKIISKFLIPYEGKQFLHVIDYADNQLPIDEIRERIIEVDISSTSIEKPSQPIKSENIKFGKTNILFRDRNSVEGVLGVQDIAEELSDIIYKMPSEQGRMIGILGEWGRGKTFLMDETWKFLNEKKKLVRIDFHAWKYQETPTIWAYLYEKFADSYYNSIPESNLIKKKYRIFKLNLSRFGRKIIIIPLISFIVSLFCFLFTNPSIINVGGSTIILTVMFGFISRLFEYKDSIKELLKKYYSKPTFKNILGSQAEIQKELKHLIKVWSKYNKELKILLFVDDIDRCYEDNIVQIIDSLRIMLDDEDISERLIIVTAIDERILKRAIKLKYNTLIVDFDNQINTNHLVTEYIDKLFLVGIRLGDLVPEEKDEFFIELTKLDRENNIVTLFSLLEEQNKQYSYSEDEDKSKITNEAFSQNINTEDTFDQNVNMKDNFDRDFGMEDTFDQSSNGETNFSQDASYDEKNTEEYIGKLSSVEIDLLRQKLQLFKKITPRQIRIFYYRYLIAKNLLIKQYNKIERGNIWLQPKYTCMFIELLIEFGKNEDREIISKQKDKVLSSNDEFFKIELIKNIELKREDYKILLNVLDIVIGY